ncbi:MAG: aminoacyl-histidine dipeptidase, partial [Bacteroidales bacterium]|nr:aminoacyl-histidine dipeptidase [Bacteroidales bacterium]
MSTLKNLEPAPLWEYFEEICHIPRLSKNEGKIRDYLLRFAEKNKLEAREDDAGNILIIREASPGHEHRKTIVLQSHMDMVGEKNEDTPHDWQNDPIKPVADREWVRAKGTTLGADDGIGMAAQMAVLTDRELRTGKIEALFTVDEETGMTGAFGLKPGFFNGRILINLDSEDEGILYIGCAGGMDTVGSLPIEYTAVGSGMTALKISVTGLRGGHSGDEIHKGLGNSVKIMTRLLLNLKAGFGIALAEFSGGNLRNAIPREAFATILLKTGDKNPVATTIGNFENIIKSELGALESEVAISISEATVPQRMLEEKSALRLLNALNALPHGVIAWSNDMPGLVETSTNLASAKPGNEGCYTIVTTQRSSAEPAKHYASSIVRSVFELAGAETSHSDGYPGWKPDPGSEILRITRESYRRLFGKDPEVKAIHAGLECGLFYEKFNGLDMVSIGPTIRGAHTPQEAIEIRTVGMFWDLHQQWDGKRDRPS